MSPSENFLKDALQNNKVMNAQTQIWHEMSSILTILTWYVNVAVHQLEFQVDNHFAQSINNVTVHTSHHHMEKTDAGLVASESEK